MTTIEGSSLLHAAWLDRARSTTGRLSRSCCSLLPLTIHPYLPTQPSFPLPFPFPTNSDL